jgi:hypothetical protein
VVVNVFVFVVVVVLVLVVTAVFVKVLVLVYVLVVLLNETTTLRHLDHVQMLAEVLGTHLACRRDDLSLRDWCWGDGEHGSDRLYHRASRRRLRP